MWLVNKLWLSLAVLLVLAAVMMSALRYALPHIPDVSAQLEQQLQQRLQQPVEIQSLALSWHRQGPAIKVTGIQLVQQADSPITVDVGTISVVLDFWQSVLQQKLIAQAFILDQASVDIDLRALQDTRQDLNLKQLESLLLQQLERFSLTNSELNITNLAGVTRSVVIERLSWLNQGQRHQGVGQFRVRDVTRNSLDFIIQLQGNDLNTIDGQLYVDSRQVDISPWLEQRIPTIDITESSVNFTSWLTLVDGNISSGLLQLRDNRIAGLLNQQPVQLHLQQGQVAIEPQAAGWLLNVQPLTLTLNEQKMALPRIAWLSQPQAQQISASGMPLHDMMPVLLPLITEQQNPWAERLTQSDWQLPVDIWLQQQDNGDFWWRIASDAVQIDDVEQLPRLQNLALQVSGNNLSHGTWQVHGDNTQITSEWLSQDPWQVDQLVFAGSWQQGADDWWLSVADSRLQVDDLQLQFNAKITGQRQATAPTIHLHAQSQQAFNVATARKLLPDIMGDGVKSYLHDALLGGRAEGVEVLWRGPLNHFPETDMQGLFNARVDFAHLDYQFQPDWPALVNTPVRLDFYQTGLFMFSDAGQLMDASLQQVNAQIPDLTNASKGLQLTSSVQGPATSLAPIFAASPLTAVSETLQQVQPQQPVSGSFSLDIPFDESRPVGVEVNADLAGQSVHVSAIEQTFGVREGVLKIANDKVSTEGFVLDWYGRPIQTAVNGSSEAERYQLTVDTSIDWQVEPLLNALPSQGWQKYFYGAINGAGSLSLTLADEITTSWQSQYDLTGLQSNLPAPLSKEFGENWQLRIDLQGDADQLQLTADIGERLSWQSQWQPGATEWQSALLSLGKPKAEQRQQLPQTQALTILANVPQVNVGEWYDLIYFLQQSSSNGQAQAGLSFTPGLIKLTTPEIRWAGQRFVDAEVEIWPQQQGWFGRAYANDAALEVSLPNDFTQQPIVVDADYLQLSSDLGDVATNTLRQRENPWQWVKRLPAMNIRCKTCKVDDKRFVDVVADLRPAEEGIELTSFTANSNQSQLQASGYWLITDDAPVTQVSGNLQSDDFGDLLRQYGLETAIRDSSADIAFGFNWQGHPHQPDLNSLGGSLEWQLGKGYLAEVSDGGARLFSVLSLDGILRKLTLDFRDIFSQGMFYTDLTGSVQLDQGIATTADTQLLGSAGNMDIQGTTNLVTNELDYQLSYAPKVTSSLPVILAWMVNPPSGLAALLIDKVLQDAEVISQLRYHVSGTIDDPQVTEVERDSRPVDIPELEETPNEQPPQEETNGSNVNRNSTQ